MKSNVNHFTNGTAFKLKYPSLDMFVARLCSLSKGCHVIKIYESGASRQLDPAGDPFFFCGGRAPIIWINHTLSLPQMLYAIWVFCLMKSSVSPIM